MPRRGDRAPAADVAALPPTLALGVVSIALAAHATSLADGFVFDDFPAIAANPLVQGPSPWRALVSSDFWGRHGGGSVGTWRPLVTLSFWIDRHLGGGGALAFHCSNVFFHALAALALALALARATARPRLAALAAALFAVLAVNGEAVASLVGRADVMAAAAAFACWYWWRRRPFVAALAFLAALSCKESAIVWPLFMAAADAIRASRARVTSDRAGADAWRSYVWQYSAVAVAAALFFAARAHAVGGAMTATITAANNPLVDASLPVRLWTAMRLTVLALRLMLLPLNSSADYSTAEIMPERHSGWEPLAGALAVALIAVAAVRLRRRLPDAALAAALFLIAWLPVSNTLVLLPTIFAERLLYLPAAGAALALALVLAAAWTRRRALAAALATVIVAGNLALDVAGDRMWHDALSLYAATVQVSPRCARAWFNYGVALEAVGQRDAAVTAYGRALEILPTWQAESALGKVLDELGQGRAAEPHLHRAVAAAPREPDAVHNLALFYARHGARAQAAALLRPLVAAHPESSADVLLLRQLEADLARTPPR